MPSNIDIDDLISAGVIGLMDAIEKYDPSQDNKFKTYAEFRIRGAILDELRSQDGSPEVSRTKRKSKELMLSWNRDMDVLLQTQKFPQPLE